VTLRYVRPFAIALAATSALLLAGCEVSHDKDGKKDNVSIGTPFGSMSVKTNTDTDGSNIGLTIYPGATPVKEDKGDSGSADVNLNFGNFHLGVKAASYQTSDPEEKVIAFYRKDLSRYGDVIACKGKETVGKPERTKEGLTCDEKDHNHINANGDDDLELRAGSPSHQHIVGVEKKDGATRIGLVSLTLPLGMSKHDDSRSE
jgi:hypothetical protein